MGAKKTANNLKEDDIVGKDRQEKKLKHSRRVESDRDQSLEHGGSAKLQSPEEARRQQKP